MDSGGLDYQALAVQLFEKSGDVLPGCFLVNVVGLHQRRGDLLRAAILFKEIPDLRAGLVERVVPPCFKAQQDGLSVIKLGEDDVGYRLVVGFRHDGSGYSSDGLQREKSVEKEDGLRCA